MTGPAGANRRYEGKTVLVTGAAGGLGRALALGFAGEGAAVVACDIAAGGLGETAAMVRDAGPPCDTHVLDVADEAAVAAFGAAVCAAHPELDLLYNNAGIAYGAINGPMETVSQGAWTTYFKVNSIAPLLLAQALRPSLAAAKGSIINQSSMASYQPATAYGVTKATLNAMTYGMATIFAVDGIRVNAIAPGLMETDASNASLPEATKAGVQGLQLLKLHGTPDDIVRLALFLASDDARFITSTLMNCDAGSRLRGWSY